jgi:hypothetical protein
MFVYLFSCCVFDVVVSGTFVPLRVCLSETRKWFQTRRANETAGNELVEEAE